MIRAGFSARKAIGNSAGQALANPIRFLAKAFGENGISDIGRGAVRSNRIQWQAAALPALHTVSTQDRQYTLTACIHLLKASDLPQRHQ